MMMTIREWFELAKAAGLPWADEALRLCVHPDARVDRLSTALMQGFNWSGDRVNWETVLRGVIEQSLNNGGGSYDEGWLFAMAEEKERGRQAGAVTGWEAYDAVREAFVECVEKWQEKHASMPSAFVGLAKTFERIDRERGSG